MKFPKTYISAGTEFATLQKSVPAPYFRKTFEIKSEIKKAELLITGLGYYDSYINGKHFTKGFFAPYRANPEHYVYFDKYDLKPLLVPGKNALAVILGNGLQNALGAYVWALDKAIWRSSPKFAFSLEIEYEDGSKETVDSDINVKTASSPIIFNDLHYGEYYDARLEIKDWNSVNFNDCDWDNAVIAPTPRGESRICEAEPIIVRNEIKPVSVTKCDNGFIYDFGINTSGLCRMNINKTEKGQKIHLTYFETLKDGKPFFDNFRFNRNMVDLFQEDYYFCKGDFSESYTPRFTYHGFRYVFVEGLTDEQATENLLTYLEMSSDLKKIGDFECDDKIATLLQQATVRSDYSNFYYFPTDCPHREKHGWTGDASLSAEQMLLNLTPEKSYREWMHNIYKSLNDQGQIPGIIPTGGWGYQWGNGPGWDSVIINLPFETFKYRGDFEIIKELAIPLMRYLTYLYSRLDENDLIAIGLGDWCQPGRKEGAYQTPLIVTDSIITVDIAKKSELIYNVLNMPEQEQYARSLAEKVTSAFRKHLINKQTCCVEGDTQTAQAMALYYGMFEESQKDAAFAHLLELIEKADGHFDTGILGGRVIFRLLAENGYADLAYNMITRTDYPSYGNWIARGATSLWETFMPEGGRILSLNHHFWGDVSAWFYRYPAGIRYNPTCRDTKNVDIEPCFIKTLNHVKASHCCNYGEIKTEWIRETDTIKLVIETPELMYGKIKLENGYYFKDDQSNQKPLKSGTYTIIKL